MYATVISIGSMVSMWFYSVRNYWERVIIPFLRIIPAEIKPDHLSWSRVPLGFLVTFFLFFYPVRLVANMLYILAWLTDILDGALARYRKQFSIWGCRIDPITDKVLNDSIFIGYGWFWRNDPEFSVMFWTIVVIVVADLITLVGAGLMSYFIEERVQANIFGKWKFGAQCTGCTMLILEWVNSARPVLEVAAALGILSAVSYCYTGCVKIRARTGRS